MSLDFDRTPPQGSGILLPVAPGIRRIVAGNASPFTFTGTCTYVIGHGDVSIIDPGPEDETHLDALIDCLDEERIARIFVTHTHRDHSPNARRLQERTGAPIFGCAPHFPARAPMPGEETRLDASVDLDYRPDTIMCEGMRIGGADHALIAVETPGHTMNHLAFALEGFGDGILFSGDHVMAWSTSIVAPPDGAMGPYMASLEKLIAREDRVYWPGHGGPVADPRRFTRGLLTHRRQRETQILERLEKAGSQSIPELVEANYPGLASVLKGAAGLSVLAHLEDLISRRFLVAEGEAPLTSRYHLA